MSGTGPRGGTSEMGIRLGRSPDQVIKSSSLMGEKSMEFSCFPQERGGLEDGRQRG